MIPSSTNESPLFVDPSTLFLNFFLVKANPPRRGPKDSQGNDFLLCHGELSR